MDYLDFSLLGFASAGLIAVIVAVVVAYKKRTQHLAVRAREVDHLLRFSNTDTLPKM